jgi:hypothetical protein
MRGRAIPGAQVTLKAVILAGRARVVDLGAGLYDEDGEDSSTGFGDLDSYQLVSGGQEPERLLEIPASLKPGRYEVVAELWNARDKGVNGKEAIGEATCATFTVR